MVRRAGNAMKKAREKDIRILEGFCAVIVMLAGMLCVLYLFHILQNHWFLNFILILGVLLHVSLALLFVVRGKKLLMSGAGLLTVFYAAGLVYFNIR